MNRPDGKKGRDDEHAVDVDDQPLRAHVEVVKAKNDGSCSPDLSLHRLRPPTDVGELPIPCQV